MAVTREPWGIFPTLCYSRGLQHLCCIFSTNVVFLLKNKSLTYCLHTVVKPKKLTLNELLRFCQRSVACGLAVFHAKNRLRPGRRPTYTLSTHKIFGKLVTFYGCKHKWDWWTFSRILVVCNRLSFSCFPNEFIALRWNCFHFWFRLGHAWIISIINSNSLHTISEHEKHIIQYNQKDKQRMINNLYAALNTSYFSFYSFPAFNSKTFSVHMSWSVWVNRVTLCTWSATWDWEQS